MHIPRPPITGRKHAVRCKQTDTWRCGADKESIFVVRANGSVVSAQQGQGGWFGVGGKRIDDVGTFPGDTIFVPEEANKTTFLQSAKDWTQVLYQLGMGIASFKVIFP